MSFFYLLVLHLPLTLCNHPQIFSIIQQNHSSSHPSLVNTNKLSLGCPLATNFAICACTIAWRCGCCGKPSAGFHHLVWLWHFELSVDGTGADCLREKKWEIRQSSRNFWIIHSHRVLTCISHFTQVSCILESLLIRISPKFTSNSTSSGPRMRSNLYPKPFILGVNILQAAKTSLKHLAKSALTLASLFPDFDPPILPKHVSSFP